MNFRDSNNVSNAQIVTAQSHFRHSRFGGRPEQRRESFFAGAGEIDDAAAGRGIARGPVQFGEAVHDGGAERAGEVMTAFAPVEAGFAHRTARVGQHFGVDLQRLRYEALAFTGELDRLLALPHQLLFSHAVEHLHAEVAGEVVVADPRTPQRRLLRPGADAGVTGAFRQARQSFEYARN